MIKYRVNVNGTNYEIALERIEESEAVAGAQKAAPVQTPSALEGGQQIKSPMPGTILSVHVSAGDTVKKGQVLLILEAMKMENEIMAPEDGRITSVSVTKGAAVESGTLLCTLG